MGTQQPNWECIGRIGDYDPIAYGGGFVYRDTTGVYPPEVTYFEPGTDEQWKDLGEKTPLKVYRFILERNSKLEWWYIKLNELTGFLGQSIDELQDRANSPDALVLAWLYADLVSYFGVEEFDSYPMASTEGEAYEKFAAEMALVRK